MTAKELERITRLEVQLESMCKRLDSQGVKLDEVHEALLTARGAKWAVVGLIGIAGTVGGIIGQFFPR